jgi:dTDP-4-amino-4,6-dideoxygalactose transaminase
MTELQAAIGVEQLKKLPGFLEARFRNAAILTEILKKSDKIILPPKPANRTPSGYLYTIRIKGATAVKRNSIIEQLHQKGIGAEAYYLVPVHQMPYYKENFGNFLLPETEKAAMQVMSLPIHPGVTEEQAKMIAETALSLL